MKDDPTLAPRAQQCPVFALLTGESWFPKETFAGRAAGLLAEALALPQ
jgi:hypothetical protein